MKTKLLLSVILLLLQISVFSKNKIEVTSENGTSNTVTVYSSPDLNPIIVQWSSQFIANADNSSKVTVNVKNIENNQSLTENGRLSFVTDEDINENMRGDLWKMVVGRDVFVPIINKQHPYYTGISRKGISSLKLSQLISSSEKPNWKFLLGDNFDAPMPVYINNEKEFVNSVSRYLEHEKSIIIASNVAIDKGIISKIKDDKYAIGFCRLVDVLGELNGSMDEDICIMPIDLNENGRLDKIENIYANQSTLARGVWIGKYPKYLYQNIYAISTVMPEDKVEKDFLNWIIDEGQKQLQTLGYLALVENEVFSKKSKLDNVIVKPEVIDDTYPFSSFILILVVAIIVAIIVLDLSIKRNRNRKQSILNSPQIAPLAFDLDSVNIPNGLYFDKSHTWAFMEKDGQVRIGIDDFLQHVTGSITQVILKEEGVQIRKGEPVLTLIQNGKQIVLNAPVSGIIKRFNSNILIDPNKLNSSPLSEGWVYMIEPSNWLRELEFMKRADRYKEWLRTEFIRLKDFIANSETINEPGYSRVLLQDGGELVENVLNKLGPEVWGDFQINFLDKAQ